MGWFILILFIIIVLGVWLLLIYNARNSKPDFEIEEREEQHASDVPDILELESRAAEAATLETAFVESAVETPVEAVLPDDLTIIEGIGPKVRSILAQSGITTFRELSQTDLSKLQRVLEDNRLSFLDPSSWAEQAQLAAEGKETDLKQFQLKLKGGR
jgi:predicted flap endonuclease-1-like 5' DNA nuclease